MTVSAILQSECMIADVWPRTIAGSPPAAKPGNPARLTAERKGAILPLGYGYRMTRKREAEKHGPCTILATRTVWS